ncbi:PTS sugar transporter subunit IIA [uncultured Vagococcus sp.]|uniref:PTS sugar transporter subunit IIA n=1 Tax=uncultured Vagococcus sp. TaxID=189676 RepID=UPI0028D426B5|nr:PTS sugar transporter subunit IIA [uncultured Vagococcus sp.]
MIEFLNQQLVFLNKSYASSDALFDDIGGQISARGFGTGQFVEKLKEREGNFPTGLNLGNYGVAIPHTDPEYITEQFISVATLNEPVSFKSMDNIEVEVPVRLVFILGLTKADNQLMVLQTLMQVIQDEQLVKEIMQEKSIKDVLSALEKIQVEGND